MAAKVAALDDRWRAGVHQAPAQRTGGNAVEVVDAHGGWRSLDNVPRQPVPLRQASVRASA
jgi:hypothetical protein